MRQPRHTAKTVNRGDFQQHVDRLLHQVTHDKIELTIEENGKPVAVVTPIEVDERRRAHQRFLDRVEEIQRRANVSAKAANKTADTHPTSSTCSTVKSRNAGSRLLRAAD